MCPPEGVSAATRRQARAPRSSVRKHNVQENDSACEGDMTSYLFLALRMENVYHVDASSKSALVSGWLYTASTRVRNHSARRRATVHIVRMYSRRCHHVWALC